MVQYRPMRTKRKIGSAKSRRDNGMNAFGNHLKLSVEGASHARCMRFSLDGFPAGFSVDADALRAFMERRAPGRDALSTARREADEVVFRSGVFDGVTDGGTIRGEIANRDMRPGDYGVERTIPRPGHADFGQWIEQGRIPTGGGKNSGRLTAPLCAAGALCLQWLAQRGITIRACIVALGELVGGTEKDRERIILEARKAGDSVGGVVGCSIEGLPPGFGGPLFEGLETGISAAVFGIPGVKGVVFGDVLGCEFVSVTPGSEYNDPFSVEDGRVVTASENQGGVLGGRTYGMPVKFTVVMRPTPTVFKPQKSVDLATMRPAECVMKGRHDPCIVRRALPVVEAVTAFAVMDAILAHDAAHPRICLTLTGKTLAEDLEQYKSQRYFTDMVELRADLLKKSDRAKVREFPKMLAQASPWRVPVVLTFRRASDGGAFKGTESERARFFKRVLTQGRRGAETGFSYVDFEEGFGGEELVALAHRAGAKIVRSLHDFNGPVPDLQSRLRSLAAAGDVAKVAFRPRNLDDVTRLFRQLAPGADVRRVPYVVMAMGLAGFCTRALAGRLGSLWTYSSVGGLSELGHVTPHELVKTYRLRTVTDDAKLFGVTGWPLKATRSPEINNAAFAAEDEDAVMVPFPSETPAAAIRFMKAAGLRGMAVTIPHKRGVMPLLDRVDPFARRVGAVNTVVREGRRLVGYNTDVAGIAEALRSFAGDLVGRSVALLGDGGAAQAVKVALRTLGARFRVFHRETPPQGYDLIVNATPVDPIPDYAFTGRESVYDLVYVPAVTPLMARAAAAGCRVENGFSMLLAQAREQRRLYAMHS